MKWCEGLGFFFCSLKCNEQKKKYNNPNPTILLHTLASRLAPETATPPASARPGRGPLSARRPFPDAARPARCGLGAPGARSPLGRAAAWDPPLSQERSGGGGWRRRKDSCLPSPSPSPWERQDAGGGTKPNPDPGGGPRCPGRRAAGRAP